MVCVRKTGAVEFRAPRDPVASNHHCLLCMSCTGSFCDCAGRCSSLRTPCTRSFADCAGRCSPRRTPYMCSFSVCAGRCPPLRTPCTRSFADCAGRCPLPRNPYTTGAFADCAGRCSPRRTPCIGSFADCAHIAPASLLLLASPLRCFLPRLRLQPPASCYPLHSADPLPCSRVCHCCDQTGLSHSLRRCSPRRCEPLLSHCPCAP